MVEIQPMLLLGDYREALADREWDACIFDAPFSRTTHKGHDAIEGLGGRSAINYAYWTPEDVKACVEFVHPRTRQWICSITDDVLAPVWRECLAAVGRYSFAMLPIIAPEAIVEPVPIVTTIPIIDAGSRCRMQGDGPSCWSTFMIVARPRTKDGAAWRTLPGHYERRQGDARSPHMGGKPFGVMRDIVRDYSNPGDLVCDITAGKATTLLAAIAEDRGALGAEVDPITFAEACERMGQRAGSANGPIIPQRAQLSLLG